jgi:hypothetical protein
MTSQLTAVMGGRQAKPSYTSEITARAAYLPEMVRRRQEIDLSNQALDIDRERLASEMAYQEKSLAANEEAAKDAMNIAKARLGLSAVMGSSGLREAIFGGDGAKTAASGAAAALAPGTVVSPGVSAGLDPFVEPTKIGSTQFNVPSLQNLVGMAGGAYAGYKLGGDSTVGKVAGAAGGALLGDALAGGTLYKDVAGLATQGVSALWSGVKSIFGY